MSKEIKATTGNKTMLANQYGIEIATLNEWIKINPTLSEAMKVYDEAKKRTLPPNIIQLFYDVLGYP